MLDILAVLSLLCAGMIAMGYFSRFELGIIYQRARPQNPNLGGVAIGIGDGRLTVWHERVNTLVLPSAITLNPPTFNWRARMLPLKLPHLSRSLWEFDAHAMSGNSAAYMYLLACPLWCIELPCFIAPAIWILKRRRMREERQGFELLESAS